MCLKESSKRVDLRPLIQVLNLVDTALSPPPLVQQLLLWGLKLLFTPTWAMLIRMLFYWDISWISQNTDKTAGKLHFLATVIYQRDKSFFDYLKNIPMPYFSFAVYSIILSLRVNWDLTFLAIWFPSHFEVKVKFLKVSIYSPRFFSPLVLRGENPQ